MTRPTKRKKGMSRGVALGLAAAGAATAGAGAYAAARRRRTRGPIDLSEFDLPEDLDHRTVEVDDGGRIHIVEAGRGRPIVLLHGVTLSVLTWTYQLRDLSDRYHVIAADQRGHGISEHGRGGLTIERMAADVASLIEELDLHDAIVVGHSMGGFVAQQIALDHPEAMARVSGLVLLSTAAAIGQGVPGWELMMRFVEPGASAVRRSLWRRGGWLPSGDVGLAVTRLAFGTKPSAQHVALAHRMTGSIAGAILAELTPGVARFDIRRRLGEIDVPTLVITGSRDLITPPRLGGVVARGIPGAEFEVVPHGGHMLMLERRDWLNARITAFAEQRVPVARSVS